MLKTIGERKREEAARRNGLFDALRVRLTRFARERNGRYIVYGSLARGEARFDSDADIIVDFPTEAEGEAWRKLEELCAELRVDLDITQLKWCDPAFVNRIMADARMIE